MEVDHCRILFAELAANYAAEVGGWDAIEVDAEWPEDGDWTEGCRLGSEDLEIWTLYHAKYAGYRMLRSDCHKKVGA